MAEYLIESPMWTADKTLYRPGRRNVADSHAKELGLLSTDAGGGEAAGEASKAAAVTYPHADLLASNGFSGWDAVKDASDADLLKIDGIGPTRLAEIRAWKPKA
jgi:hypothetical protein